MKSISEKLLILINQNKTVNEISEELGLSNKQIYNILRMIESKGFAFQRKYHENGDIIYSKCKELITFDGCTNIFTNANSNNFRALVISDLHIGNSKQRLDLLDKIYNYCAKESINTIFITGDLLDGTYSRSPQVMSPSKQIDYLIKNYPFDKNILNYVVLGDHDYSILVENGQNLQEALKNYRHDIIPIGYKLGEVNIKRDKLTLYHEFNETYKSRVYGKLPNNNSIIFRGHYHNGFRIQQKHCDSNILIDVPSLSDIHMSQLDEINSAILAEFTFNKNIFSSLKLNQLIINNNIMPINEIVFQCTSSVKNNANNTYILSKKK